MTFYNVIKNNHFWKNKLIIILKISKFYIILSLINIIFV